MEMSFAIWGLRGSGFYCQRHKCYLLLFFQSLQGRVWDRGWKDRQTDWAEWRERRERVLSGATSFCILLCLMFWRIWVGSGRQEKIVSRLLKWMFMWVKYLSTSHTGFGTFQKAFFFFFLERVTSPALQLTTALNGNTCEEGLNCIQLRGSKLFIYSHLRGNISHLSPPASVFSLLLHSRAQVLGFIYESPCSHETWVVQLHN